MLHAADLLLVPLIPTTLSVRTLDQLTDFVSGFNGHKPDILAFFSMIDRRKRLHKQIAAELPARAYRLRCGRHPGGVGDRADVGAPGPGDRVRAAQPGRARSTASLWRGGALTGLACRGLTALSSRGYGIRTILPRTWPRASSR